MELEIQSSGSGLTSQVLQINLDLRLLLYQWVATSIKMEIPRTFQFHSILKSIIKTGPCRLSCTKTIHFQQLCDVVEVLLYVHRNRRLIRDRSPGCPPQLSHSSWALCCVKNLLLLNITDWTAHAEKEWCPELLAEYWIVPVDKLVRKNTQA